MLIDKVLLTGGRAPATLELARLFAQAGMEVQIADSFPHALSRRSKYVSKFHVLPRPKQEPDRFIHSLAQVILQEEIGFLVPTCEEIFMIAARRNQLPGECIVYAERADRLLRLHHKHDFIQWAAQIGLSIPETHRVSSPQEWAAQIARLPSGTRYIAKPVYTRFASEILLLPEQAHAGIEIHESKPWVIQRFIDGEQICTYSIAYAGRLLAHTAYRSDYRVGNGATIAFAHIEEKTIEAWVRQFVERAQLSGQFAFDFIRDSSGAVYPIECNPRLTSGIHLFRHTPIIQCIMHGIDYDEGEGKTRKTDKVGHGSEIGNEIGNKIGNGLVPVLKPASERPVSLKAALALYAWQQMRTHGWRDYIRTLVRSDDAVFSLRDPMPFLDQFCSLVPLYRLARRERLSITEASTYDISWDGDAD